MRDKSPVHVGALLVGIVFLAVGVLGFIPGITTNYGDMTFIGEGSADNWLHLGLSVGILGLGLVLSRDVPSERSERLVNA